MKRHAEVLQAMQDAHPTLRTKLFRREMMAAFGGESDALRRVIDRFCYLPDAYFLRPELREVQVFEVVVWHVPPPHKMAAYADLIAACAECQINLELWIVDENGASVQLSTAKEP